MIVHVSKDAETITLRVRAESPSAVGDFTTTVKPGQTALGKPYEWWASQPEGPIEFEPKPTHA